MEFKYSISLLFSNMGYVLKIFLWVLLTMLITACIGAAILIPVFDALAVEPQVATAYGELSGEVNAFLDGGVSIRSFITEAGKDCLMLIRAVGDAGGLVAALVICLIFLYALYTFLVTLSYYPTSYAIDKLMSSNMRIGLASSAALNFRQALKFALCRLLISLPIDIALLVVGALLFAGLFIGIGIFAFPVMLVIIIAVLGLRACFFAGWLPRLLFVKGESYYTSFGRSLRSVKVNIKGLMKAFTITFFASIALISTMAIPTFGLVVVVIPAINYFLFRAIELVGYYKMNGLSFYTDAANVVNTVEFGYRAQNQTDAVRVDGDEE